MPGFTRKQADYWHRDVPGARWFKTDLHVHTIDDLPGGRAKMPPGLPGPAASDQAITAYARCFLKKAVEHNVRVIALTPHSPRIDAGRQISAAWRIVEEWNAGMDDDGTPFRDKVYAVFPGFEPSLHNGRSGLHLLFIFDPEIGREDYFKAFDLVMCGVSPWNDTDLQLSGRSADGAFDDLRNFHAQARHESGSAHWSYLMLAPHVDNEKGLIGSQKAQVLQRFRHGEIAGLELGDEKLPEDTVRDRDWLTSGMAEHRQAFFHGSDAYSVEDIGRRHTWFKLASPRVEALRQAFIASDSRMRIAYQRNASGHLTETPAPDVTVSERPWLKSITVKGRASFFGATDDRSIRFDLSPDLTCIIGGSMTGKSTLLDGLRVHVGAPLPQDHALRVQVEARGRERFLGGSPEVSLECPGSDSTSAPHERWPAVFHAQNELQRLAQAPEAIEDILTRLAASEMSEITDRKTRLEALDRELNGAVRRLAKLDEDLADTEQAFDRCRKAAADLEAFSGAGIENLHRASRDYREWHDSADQSKQLAEDLSRLLQLATSLEMPDLGEALASILSAAGICESGHRFRERWTRIHTELEAVSVAWAEANAVMEKAVAAMQRYEHSVRTEVERKLAERGLAAAKIKEFQALSRHASLLTSYEAAFKQTWDRRRSAEHAFEVLIDNRSNTVGGLRAAFDRVIEAVRSEFDGRFVARRIDSGDSRPLDRFLRSLNQRGVTRWWNELPVEKRPAPQALLDALDDDEMGPVGMSRAVQASFREAMSQARRRELAAIRCPDRYVLELRMEDGSPRRLDDLSGGQRVSVLLSLLLETNDERPLVIDQPEDELDNRFLFDTVLPALKRLKGSRQIIVATHNANIVVNGDADQVIRLEATANQGRVAEAGAIEDPAVRDAIVRTVDGGDDAFRLRRLKYGF